MKKYLIMLVILIVIVILVTVSGLWIIKKIVNWGYYDYDTYYKKYHLDLYSTTPTPITPTMLIKNGDFEDKSPANYWYVPHKDAKIIFDRKGINNSYCAIIEGSNLENDIPLAEYFIQRISITDVKIAQIAISAWIKTEELKGKSYFSVLCSNTAITTKDNKEIYGILKDQDSSVISGDTPWTSVSMNVDIPLTTKIIKICFICSGTKGKSYFDDIEVRAIAVYEKKQ
jgi:hypothetical protein